MFIVAILCNETHTRGKGLEKGFGGRDRNLNIMISRRKYLKFQLKC